MNENQFNDPIFLIYHHFEQQILNFFEAQSINQTIKSWLVLKVVIASEGISQREIATRLGLNKVRVGRLLDQLEDEALVVRIGSPHDSREKNIYATKVAKGKNDLWNRQINEMMKKSMQEIDPDLCIKGADFLTSWLNSLRGN